jgi:hypothetical protein
VNEEALAHWGLLGQIKKNSLKKAVTVGVSCCRYFVSMQINSKTYVNYQEGQKIARINNSQCQCVLHADRIEEGSEHILHYCPSACFQVHRVYIL